MKYVFENKLYMPLCAYKDNTYFNYLDGQVIDNENVLNFIKEGIKNKSMIVKEIDLVIYKINRYRLGEINDYIYNYQLNGTSNYLDINKQPLLNEARQFVIDKLMSGEYIQKLIWGDSNE